MTRILALDLIESNNEVKKAYDQLSDLFSRNVDDSSLRKKLLLQKLKHLVRDKVIRVTIVDMASAKKR